MNNPRTSLLQFLLAFSLLSAGVFAGDIRQDDPEQAQDLFTLDLNSLINLKVTTASKFSERVSDAPGVMSVVTQDELRRFGGITLREILERVPGLSGATASFTDRSIVAARGDQTKINGGHILFLINGRPTREVLEGGIVSDLLESFPVNALEKIEVIRGPGSVLYGSTAFSAVVNLITLKADSTQLTLSSSGAAGGGTANTGHFTYRRGNLSLIGAGQYHQKPAWNTPVWSVIYGRENPVIPDRGKGAYLGLNYKGLSIVSSFTEWKTAYIEGAVGDARWRRGFADVGYSLQVTPRWDMSVNVTFTRSTLDAVKSIPFIDRDSHEALVEWTNRIRFSDKSKLAFGTLYNHIEGLEHFYGFGLNSVIADGSRHGQAFYAQMDHELAQNLKLIGGFQANKIGHLDLDVVPRAGIIWYPARRFNVKALYSEAFRAPSLNETLLHYAPPPGFGGPSLTGDPNLAPEKVATVDFGLGYQGNRFEAGVNAFYSKHTNSIILVDPWGDARYVNSGRTGFRGVEAEGRYYFKRNFFFTASALYQTNKDGQGNRNVTPVANVSGKAGISYHVSRGLTASLFNVYQGPLHGYSLARNPKPEAHHRLNAHFRYDLTKYLHPSSKTGLAVVVHADNLTGKPIWLPDWKDTPGDTIFVNRGRTVYFGLEFVLKAD
jgi:outer membrane receptor for ferrienterochelin and colicin